VRHRLQQLILAVSRSAPWSALVLAGAVAALLALQEIGARIERVVGSPPFDLQHRLSLAEIAEQLPRYTDEARRLYGLFFAVDMAFPLLAALFLAGACAFLMRRGLPAHYQRLAAGGWFSLLLLPAAFDWLENLAALTLVLAGTAWTPAGLLLIGAKALKLATTMMVQLLVLLLSLLVAARALVAVLRRPAR
jgi:hypothetical protein